METSKVVTVKTKITVRLSREDVEYALRRKHDLPESAIFDWSMYNEPFVVICAVTEEVQGDSEDNEWNF